MTTRASVKQTGKTGSGLCAVETVHWRARLAAPAPLFRSLQHERGRSFRALPAPPFTPSPPPPLSQYLLFDIHSRDSETWKKSKCTPALLTVKYIPQILLLPASKQRCSCSLSLLYPFLFSPIRCVCAAVMRLSLCERLCHSRHEVQTIHHRSTSFLFFPGFLPESVCVRHPVQRNDAGGHSDFPQI